MSHSEALRRYTFLCDFVRQNPMSIGQHGAKEMRALKQQLSGLRGDKRDAAVLSDIQNSRRDNEQF